MEKRINVMALWKEFNPSAKRSMRDDFSEEASPLASKIIAYLDSGEVVLASPSSSVDMFSGERISHTTCILTDGVFSWTDSLSYYVQRYNLRLPSDFLDQILSSRTENCMEK